jgi:DNA-directed RNA polymerase
MTHLSTATSQESLMEKAREEGAARYAKKLGLGGIHTPWGREMATRLRQRFTASLRDWALSTSQRKAGQLIPQAKALVNGDLDAIAFVAMRTIFGGMADDRSKSSIAVEIGGMIDFEITGQKAWQDAPEEHTKDGLIRWFKDNHKSKAARHRSMKKMFLDFGHAPEWSLKDRTRLGITIMNMFRDISGIIDFVNVSFGNKRLRTVVVVTQVAQDWIQAYNEHAEFLKPVRYPTVIPPKPWTDLWSGGYPSEIKYPLIKLRRKEDQDYLKSFPLQRVMEAANAMQSVPWRVNKRMLEVMREYHRLGLCVNEVIPFSGVIPLPMRVETEDKEEIKEYKRQAHQIHLTNYQNRAKCVAVAKILCAAETMKGYEEIFFPVQLDFRGRMYCFNETLHYQAGDTSRALLEFAEAKPLGQSGIYWLAIHGANKWGLDKTTFDERIKWVSVNDQNIKKCAEDPYSYNWWTMADEPWQFLAFCMEYSTATPDTLSRLPCSLDATNNGLQILSLLMRDTEGAKRTNVHPTDNPCDLYLQVAMDLTEALSNMNEGYAQALLDAGAINRKLVKVPVMTIPYGVTNYGIIGHLDAALAKALFDSPEAQKIIPMSERREVSKWLTPILIKVMEPYLGKSKLAMKWLKTVTSPVIKAGRVCRWLSPSGFPVNNEYRKHEVVSIDTAVGEKYERRNLTPETNELDAESSLRTVPPNFVHSLDASVAHLVARELGYMRIPFGIVHDCFFSHASDLQKVKNVVIQQYRNVFSRDLLENLRMQLTHQHPDLQFEQTPELGNFVVDEILKSDYFLS